MVGLINHMENLDITVFYDKFRNLDSEGETRRCVVIFRNDYHPLILVEKGFNNEPKEVLLDRLCDKLVDSIRMTSKMFNNEKIIFLK